MRIKPRDLIFLAIVIAAVGSLYFLSTRAKEPRPMPVNPTHADSKTREQCLACHKPEQMEALQAAHKHPSKWRDARVNCLQCHKPAQAKATFNSDSEMRPVVALRGAGEDEELLLWLRQRRN